MIQYKVLKEIRIQNHAGKIIIFAVGGKVTEKDFAYKRFVNGETKSVFNKKLMDGFIKDGFLIDEQKENDNEKKLSSMNISELIAKADLIGIGLTDEQKAPFKDGGLTKKDIVALIEAKIAERSAE